MSEEKFFDFYRHSLGTVNQNEQLILRAQNEEVIEMIGAPGVTRTRGTRIRNPLLYPPELQGQPLRFQALAMLPVSIISSISTIFPLFKANLSACAR